MTPERLEYEKELAAVERQTRAARRELNDLILGAEEFDLVLTIETDPHWPPEMGHYDMVGNARLSRERYQRLAALKAAADEADEGRKLCDGGFHSWIDETGKLSPDTKCTRCGELYGDPT
jgi:hypothetical protein